MSHSSTANFGPYSPIRRAGEFYYISGQVGVSDGSAASNVTMQTEQALNNLQNVLKSADLTMAEVVKTTVFLKNMADFGAVNKAYMSHFPEPRPARSCIEVAALPNVADNELLVEIEAIAYKDSSK
jgi:2-iminobutanoate/2-iminopropanoate deaminase